MSEMRIRVLFFATYRDIAGADELRVEVPSGARIGDVVARLRESGGRWAELPAAPAVALNMEYAPLSSALADGDEVALIPPVSGG